MRRIAIALLLLAPVAAGCAARLDRLTLADRWLRQNRTEDARAEYLALAVSPTASKDPAVRVRALVGAAHASLKLRDPGAARLYFERAVRPPDVPGATAAACFEYAVLLEDEHDRPRALALYYRAAAAGPGALHDRALSAIARLSK